MKKWILKTFFKKELASLYWAFENVETQVRKTQIHKPSKARIDKAISNFRKAFIAIQTKNKNKKK